MLTAEQAASLEFPGWADPSVNWRGDLCTKGVGKRSLLSEVCLLPALLSGGREGSDAVHNGLYQKTSGPAPPLPHQYGLISTYCTYHIFLFKKWRRGFYPPSEYKASCQIGIPFFSEALIHRTFDPSIKGVRERETVPLSYIESLPFCLWSHHRKILSAVICLIQCKARSALLLQFCALLFITTGSLQDHQVKLFCFIEAEGKRSINLLLVVEQKHQTNSKDHFPNRGHWPLPKPCHTDSKF